MTGSIWSRAVLGRMTTIMLASCKLRSGAATVACGHVSPSPVSPQSSTSTLSPVQDFTGGGIHALTSKPPHTAGDESIDARIRQLVRDYGCEKSCDLIEEMITTALKMGHDQTTTADLKLFNRSLKELRYAAKVFAPYRDRRKIVIFGSARTGAQEPESIAAEEFAR